jgi:hypothetical protein
MHAALPSQLTPVAAVDPIAIFIAFIIIVNVISALTKRARQISQGQPAPTTETQPQPSGLGEAMRTASADLAAARAAQRTRLEQAIRAASQQAAQRLAAPVAMTRAPSAPSPERLPTPLAPGTAPAALQLETLPSFEYADVAGGLMSVVSIAPTVSSPTTLPILNDRLTLADFIVASAIIGPPASVRPPGHTPAGW